LKSSESSFRFQMQWMQNSIAILVIVFSVLLVPTKLVSIAPEARAIGVSCLLAAYSFQLLLSRNQKLNFSLADLGWLFIIVLSFISANWALNPFQAIYGGCTILLLYLAYRLFLSIEWTAYYQIIFRLLLLIIGVTSLGIIIYSELYLHGQPHKIVLTNTHYLGSLVVTLLPFILPFKKGKAISIFSSLILLSLSIVIYRSGSLQVLLCLIITALYLISSRNRFSLSRMAYLLLTTIVIGGICFGIFKKNKESVTNKVGLLAEFDQQNDRLEMWKNSARLFIKSPILGVGKNNWKEEVTQFGLGGYGKWQAQNPGMFNHAHNWFFQIIAEQGLLGLLSYLIIFASCIFSLCRTKEIEGSTYAALFSSLSFLWLGLIYGIVYNQFGRFQGLPVIMSLCIAIIHRSPRKLVSLRSRVCGIIFLLCSILCLVFFSNYRKAKSWSYTAEVLLRRGQPQEALNTLSRINNFYNKKIILEQTARANAKLGNNEIAANDYYKALHHDPYNVKLLHDYASYLYSIGHYSEALQYAKRAYNLSEGFSDNTLLIVECLYNNGNTAEMLNYASKLNVMVSEIISEIEYWRTLRPHKARNEKQKQHIKKYTDIKMRLDQILRQSN